MNQLLPLLCMGFAATWFAYRLAVHRPTLAVFYPMLLYLTFLGRLSQAGSVSIPVVMAATLMLFEYLDGYLSPRRRAPVTVIDLLVVGLVLWCLLVASIRNAMFGGDLGPIRDPMVFGMVVMASKMHPELKRRDLALIPPALLLGGMAIAVVCILQFMSSDATLGGLVPTPAELIGLPRQRTPGLQGNPNGAATYLVIGYAAALVLASWRGMGFWRLAGNLGVVLILTALVVTQSRSGILAALAMTGTRIGMVFGFGRATPVLLVFAGLAGLLFLPDLLLQVGEQMMDRQELRVSGREERWAIGFQVMQENPLFGDNISYMGVPINYHNDLLQLVGYFGLPAGVTFFVIEILMLKNAWRTSLAEGKVGYGNVMLLALIGGMTHGLFHVAIVSGICFWMLLGLGANNFELQKLAGGRR